MVRRILSSKCQTTLPVYEQILAIYKAHPRRRQKYYHISDFCKLRFPALSLHEVVPKLAADTVLQQSFNHFGKQESRRDCVHSNVVATGLKSGLRKD
jgi:hypothetical protein